MMRSEAAVEQRAETGKQRRQDSRLRVWLLGLLPLALIGVAIAVFAATGAPGLGERVGPPAEDLVVERTVLRPGQIVLTIRNDGPDPVQIAQVAVNDAYVNFRSTVDQVGRLETGRLTIDYPWVKGEAYQIFLLTSTGGTVEHEIPVAAQTPAINTGFYGLMTLIGIYVGVIPVALGMFWLPWLRRLRQRWMRFAMALTIGLLVFLAVDAGLEAIEIASTGPQAFGGPVLVFLGAFLAFVGLAAIDTGMRAKRNREGQSHRGAASADGLYVALLVSVGIGLHNLGEGLAIGAAYSVGALALGALLIIGFALHNTTEGLAIVAPIAARKPSLPQLMGLGVIAGAPAIPGAWIGVSAYHPSLSAFLLALGVGAIAQVVAQLAPFLRRSDGRYIHLDSVMGLAAGLAILYLTGLLISV